MLELVLLKDGRQLDVVSFGGGEPQFRTGSAQAAVQRLAVMSGLKGPSLERFADGWSNGYVTLRGL